MSFTIYNKTHVCILTIFANISFSETLKSLKWIFKKSMGKTHKNQISAADNSKIDPRGFLCIYDIFSRPFSKYLMHIEKFQIFHFFHFWQITHQSLKKVCDKVSKVKIPKQLFVSFFHASCHGRLVFYPNQIYVGPIWLLKWSILAFSEKLKSLKLIFKNPWVKNVKIKFLLHTIQTLTQEDYFAHMTYFPGHSKKCVMHIDKFQIFHFFHFWKITHQSLKKVCDEVSKIKIVKQIFFSFFHAGHHGMLVFSRS